MLKSNWLRVGGSLIAIALLYSPAHAQTAIQGDPSVDESASSNSNVIVVTAQRREQNLQETAVTLTALDAGALSDQGIVDVQGIARAVPNL
jgi:iron complex outermembrane receptor protein